MNKTIIGNLLALFTVLIWASTFLVSSKLLETFSPINILIYRLIIAYLSLLVLNPKSFKTHNWKIELLLMGMGLTGITLYQLGEYFSLSFTSPNNVAIITSTAPFFTAIFACLFLKTEKINLKFVIGFIISIIGVSLVTFNGIFELDFNPLGNVIAFLAIISWAMYSVIPKYISKYNYNIILVTRRTFLYGVMFSLPFYLFNGQFDIIEFNSFEKIFSICYLGIIASGICFSTWNVAIRNIGAIKTCIYLYLMPLFTILFTFIFLNDRITFTALIGTILVVIGLFISTKFKKETESVNQES